MMEATDTRYALSNITLKYQADSQLIESSTQSIPLVPLRTQSDPSLHEFRTSLRPSPDRKPHVLHYLA